MVCDLAEPESSTSLGGSAPGVVDGILSAFTAKSKVPLFCSAKLWLIVESFRPSEPPAENTLLLFQLGSTH